jgi:hypothetical protein
MRAAGAFGFGLAETLGGIPSGRDSLLSHSVTNPLPRNRGAVFCLKARVQNRL